MHPHLSSHPTILKSTRSSKKGIRTVKSYFISLSLDHDFYCYFVLCNSLNGKEPPPNVSQEEEFISNLRDSSTPSCSLIHSLSSLALKHTPTTYPISNNSSLVLKYFKTAIIHLRKKSTFEASSTSTSQSKEKEKESRWGMWREETKPIKKLISKVFIYQYRTKDFQSCQQDKRRRLLRLVENAD